MQPEIDLGPITLQTFGLMMGLAFVVAGLAASRFMKELGKPVDWAYEMVFAALVGGIVGARLWWVAENWSDAQDDLLGSLFSGSGLVWYGGALGGAVGRAPVGLAPQLADAADVRRRGRAAGRRATRSGGSAASSRATATTASRGTGRGRWPIRTARCRPPRRSTRRRSTRRSRWASSRCCCGAGATAGGPGTLFGLYLVLAGAERFLVEFVRRNDDVFLGLTQPQLLSIVMMAGGGIMLWALNRRAEPAPARAAGQRA